MGETNNSTCTACKAAIDVLYLFLARVPNVCSLLRSINRLLMLLDATVLLHLDATAAHLLRPLVVATYRGCSNLTGT
jgi:hypothetical protein